MSWFSSQPMNDADQGKRTITYFHNRMTLVYPDQYSISYNELIDQVSADPVSFVSEVGFVINSVDMSDSKAESAMDDLVDASQGRVPKMSAFFNVLGHTASTLTFFDYVKATPMIAAETAGDVASGVAKVGDSIIQTGSILTKVAPFAIVAALLFVLYGRTREFAGR